MLRVRLGAFTLAATVVAFGATACDSGATPRAEGTSTARSLPTMSVEIASTPRMSSSRTPSAADNSRIDKLRPQKTCQDANSRGDSSVDTSSDLVVGPAAFVGARTVDSMAGLISRYGGDGLPSSGDTISFKIATMVKNGSRVVVKVAPKAAGSYSLSSSSVSGEAIEFVGCSFPKGGYTAWASSFILHRSAPVCLPLLVTEVGGKTYNVQIAIGGSKC